MFRAKRNYPFDDLASIPPIREYKIGLNDQVQIAVSPNKGASLLEGTGASTQLVAGAIIVVVEFDGTVKMPILGRILLKDLTVREAELLIEERYKQIYVDPFVIVKVLNKRVILFRGEGGAASVITLINQNTTLTEVIAQAGGISPNGKARRIKLIRGDPKNPQVYLIDLSTIDGMKKGDVVLQGNDIVYIEPKNDLVLNFGTRISSYSFLVTLAIFYYSFVK